MNDELVDIRPIIKLTDPFPSWIWWAAAGLLLLGLLAWFLVKRFRSPATSTTVTVEPSPYDWFEAAMRGIAPLRQDAVEYCHRLSFVFREYIERRYQFPATDRTSEELLRELRRLHLFSEDEAQTLRQLFQLLDPVKYAARRPSGDDVTWAEKTVRDLASRHRPPSDTPGVKEASHATATL